MGQKAKVANRANHERQLSYLRKGIVMLPTLKEERQPLKRRRPIRLSRPRPHRGNGKSNLQFTYA